MELLVDGREPTSLRAFIRRPAIYDDYAAVVIAYELTDVAPTTRISLHKTGAEHNWTTVGEFIAEYEDPQLIDSFTYLKVNDDGTILGPNMYREYMDSIDDILIPPGLMNTFDDSQNAEFFTSLKMMDRAMSFKVYLIYRIIWGPAIDEPIMIRLVGEDFYHEEIPDFFGSKKEMI